MPKFAPVALIILLIAGAAVAKDKGRDTRIEAVLECADITQPDERLQCYDSKMTGFRQAVETGRVIAAEDSTKPFALEGVVRGAGEISFNRYYVILDTGDRWELVANSNDTLPQIGAKVKLRKGAVGTYWFQEPYASDRRAKYRGRKM